MGWFPQFGYGGLVNSYVKVCTIGHSHHKLWAAVHVSTTQNFDCEWFCDALFSYTNAGWSLKMTFPPFQFASSFRPLCHDLAGRTRGWPNRFSKFKFLWTPGRCERKFSHCRVSSTMVSIMFYVLGVCTCNSDEPIDRFKTNTAASFSDELGYTHTINEQYRRFCWCQCCVILAMPGVTPRPSMRRHSQPFLLKGRMLPPIRTPGIDCWALKNWAKDAPFASGIWLKIMYRDWYAYLCSMRTLIWVHRLFRRSSIIPYSSSTGLLWYIHTPEEYASSNQLADASEK